MSVATRPFHQVDVFTAEALAGNPLAVVHDADGLTDAQMAALARWTNLSETTFLLPPTEPGADYRVRIFTPFGELPFAGHPTLGSCWAWLQSGGTPRAADRIVQQCAVGLVPLRRDGGRLAFAAPPRRRTGPLAADLLRQACTGLGLAVSEVRAHQWVDNGPGWIALLLPSAERVRALRPDWPALDGLKLGVVGATLAGSPEQFEVRAFVGGARPIEDPVTGSLNASIAQWLMAAGHAPDAYVAIQGSVLQRRGLLHLRRDGDTVWVAGDVTPVIEGRIHL